MNLIDANVRNSLLESAPGSGKRIRLSGPCQPNTAAVYPLATPEEKSIVLDRAYDEYCELLETGSAPDLSDYCSRYPAFESSLQRLLQAHQFFHNHPDLLAPCEPPAWPEPGQEFLGFRLDQELGRGAFARVFLARELALGNRLVAVKISREGMAEAETLAQLDHPNIVPIHSSRTDVDTGLTVICMPFLGQATLAHVLEDRVKAKRVPKQARDLLATIRRKTLVDHPIPGKQETGGSPLEQGSYVDGIVHLALGLSKALVFVHSREIYHCDLKPSNVLLTPDGQPMLLDFNLSWNQQHALPRIGGTLPYMSPEQLEVTAEDFRGTFDPIDARTDIYALGVILYELLTGQHPLGELPTLNSTKEMRAYLVARQRLGATPLRRLNPQVDRPLAKLIDQCLARDPNKRPASAAELVVFFQKRLARLHHPKSWFARVACVALIGLSTLSLGGIPAAQPSSPRQAGQQHYRFGRYSDAIEQLTQAHEKDPKEAGILFERGRAKLKLAENTINVAERENLFGEAQADFQAALDLNGVPKQLRKLAQLPDKVKNQEMLELKQEGPTLACLGYCLVRLQRYDHAMYYFRAAIGVGYRRAEVYNDLFYAANRVNGKKDEARDALETAILLNPDLPAARHNRALLLLQKACRCGNLPHHAKAGLRDIQRALMNGPANAGLYRDAACLAAVAGDKELARNYLCQAIEQGESYENIVKDSLLKPVCNAAFLGEFAAKVDPEKPRRKPEYVVDPIKETGS